MDIHAPTQHCDQRPVRGTTAIATFGLLVIFAQNVGGMVAQALPEWAATFLYFGGVFTLGGDGPVVACKDVKEDRLFTGRGYGR